MRILITNITLGGRTGTETVTRDLALGYLAAGATPVVYTRRLGAISQELARAGIAVTDRVEALSGGFDVIHGHHLNACIAPLARFPETPAIFVLHDVVAWHDAPPRLAQIRRYAAISDGFAARLAEAGVPPSERRVVLNGVDTARFRPGPIPAKAPRRALAFAKNEGHVEAIRQACALRDIALDVVGARGERVIEAPETVMPGYDLVFGSGRAAIEAMACLRPVVVCDGRGLAGMVDAGRYPSWRRENFGLAALPRPVTVEACLEEIDRYDPAEARAVGERLREEANLAAWTRDYLAVLEEAIASPVPTRSEIDADLARHLEVWSPGQSEAWPWMVERERLIRDQSRLLLDLEPLVLEQRLLFGADEPWDRHARLVGFHQPEPWGAWSAEESVELRLAAPAVQGRCAVDLVYKPLVAPQGGFSLVAAVNGRAAASRAHAPQDSLIPQTLRIPVEPALLGGGGLWINLRTRGVSRPCDLGVNGDERPMGFGLIGLAVAAL